MDRNILTLLAVLTLSVSNLFVGVSTQNAPLIYASSAISATLAVLYLLRDRLGLPAKPAKQRQIDPDALTRTRPFPLWVFVMVLFIILPALLVFLRMYGA